MIPEFDYNSATQEVDFLSWWCILYAWLVERVILTILFKMAHPGNVLGMLQLLKVKF